MKEKSLLTEIYEKTRDDYNNGVSMYKILALCLFLVATIIIVSVFAFCLPASSNNDWEVSELDKRFEPQESPNISLDNYTFDITEEIYSRAAIVINYTTGNVVCKKNESAELFPASLTKMMTVLVAMENISDLSVNITVDGKHFGQLSEAGASVAGLVAGEKVTAMDLCYATILPSGADAALTLAEYVSGSEEDFVVLMNKKAKELGMADTHFCNVSGLHNDEHYSTAYDLALMMQYAMKNDNFYKVITSEEYTIPPDSAAPNGLYVYSTVFDKANKMTINKLNTAKLLGGKSGYTPEAGLCLATVCKTQDYEYITVTLCADGTLYTPQYAMIDTYTLINNYAY